MQILFISTIYPTPAEVSKGVFNRNLVNALASHHHVEVLAPIPWPKDPPWRRTAELGLDRVRELDGIRVHHPRYYYFPKVFNNRSAWFYWQSVRGAVGRLLTSFRPDMVIGYWAHPDGAIAVQIARQTGARSGVIVGGSDVLILTQSAARRGQVLAALRAADAVLAVSDHLRRRVIDLGVDSHRSHLWHQGIETRVFHPGAQSIARSRLGISNGDPVIVWVGRMVAVKGLDVLTRACALLASHGIQFRLYLIGDGPLRSRLETEVGLAGLADRVVFVGPCAQDRLADWYRAADLTVLPSRSEGLPNVLRESVSCDTPFVASRVGGIAEIADEGLDRLVPPEDPEALVDAIKLSLAARHCRPNRRYQPQSWAESGKRLIDLLTGPSPDRRDSDATCFAHP